MSISYKSLVMAAKNGETLDEVAEKLGKTVEDFKKEVYKRLNKKAANDLLSRLESNAKSKEKKSEQAKAKQTVAEACLHESGVKDSPASDDYSDAKYAATEETEAETAAEEIEAETAEEEAEAEAVTTAESDSERTLEELKETLEANQNFFDTLKNTLKCIEASKADLNKKMDDEKNDLQRLTQAVTSLIGRVEKLKEEKAVLSEKEEEVTKKMAETSKAISVLEQEIMSKTAMIVLFDEESQFDVEREELIKETVEVFEIVDDETLTIYEAKKIALWLCILRKLENENPGRTIQVKFKEESNISKCLVSYGKNVVFE